MADSSKLSSIFIVELLKCCLTDSKILNLCRQHLSYAFLENDHQKKVFKFILDSEALNGISPTTGIIAQAFPAEPEVLNLLSQIKKTFVANENKDGLITSFEDFIRRSKFVGLFNSVHDLYQNNKQDDAIELMAQESQKISEFKLKDNYYTTVFGDYTKRDEERRRKAVDNPNLGDKMPFGILPLDRATFGGVKRGTSCLFLAMSGKGKTTMLRWMGIANARIGKRVVHFQIEGSEAECLEGYDAAWSGTSLSSFDTQDYGAVSEETIKKIQKARRNIIANKGEVFVYAAESFDDLTIEKSREIVMDIEELHGKVDLIVWDYLEVMNTAKDFGKGEVAERRRREYISKQMTNICIELKCAGASAIQSNNVDPKNLINPDYVLTRNNISEFKGALQPFSYFITINCTPDEERNNIVRLYCDKFRKHKAGMTFTIAQKKEIGRFFDSERYLREFHREDE